MPQKCRKLESFYRRRVINVLLLKKSQNYTILSKFYFHVKYGSILFFHVAPDISGAHVENSLAIPVIS